MKINLNNLVRVKLTRDGLLHLKSNQFYKMLYKNKIKNNIFTIELWDLMNLFGQVMILGAHNMFVGNQIDIIEEQ